MSINMLMPQEMQHGIAGTARTKRLSLNLSQQTLSEQSGVSYGVLKKFEQTGQISLEGTVKLTTMAYQKGSVAYTIEHIPKQGNLRL